MTITSANIHNPRDILFFQEGQIMMIASAGNSHLLFFNRTDYFSRSYQFFYKQRTSFSTPHGLLYINDTFFFATAWGQKAIYSYSFNNNTSWTETLHINASSITSLLGGSHLMIDECQRR
jgi:hypothetical protein